MSQIWMDGFDHYGGSTGNMLDGAWANIDADAGAGPDLSAPAAGARTGSLCFRFGVGGVNEFARRVLGGNFTEIFTSCAVFVNFLPEAGNSNGPIQLRTASNSEVVTLTVGTDGSLSVRSGDVKGTILASTSGPVITANTWHHIECRFLRDAAAGIAEVKVDGVEVINATGLNFGATDFGQLALYYDTPSGITNTMYIDDLIVRDETGTTNNTFMGDLRVATLQPIANGANQGWSTQSRQKLDVGVMNFSDPGSPNEAVTYADSAVFEIGSGDFCIEGFVRFSNDVGINDTASIFSKYRASTDERSWRLALRGASVGGDLIFQTSTDGTLSDEVTVHAFPFVPILKRWYHVAVARSGTSSRMFIDGQQVGLTMTDSRTYFDGTARVFVNGEQSGSNTAVTGGSVDGWMDGVRYTVGAARYTANFAPPTAALPDTVGGDALYNSVELLLNFDDASNTDQSSNAFTGSILNGAFVEFPDDSIAYQTITGLGPDDLDFVEAALVAAQGTLTLTANPLDTETVVIGATTYTFQTVLVDVADNVLIGVDAETSLDNLLAAVNLEAGAGTTYGTGTVQNVSASLLDLPNEQVLATARTAGAAGNSVASTTTVTGGSWGGATLSGGADIPSNSEFTVSQLPPEVTAVRAVAVVGRNFKTDNGASELTMSYVTESGSAAAGANRPLGTTPVYYEDTFEQDPATLGALTPSSVLNARIRLNRTL